MSHTTNVQAKPKLHKLNKADIILDLVISLNKGNSGTIADRPGYAIEQYRRLVEAGVIKEEAE